MLLLYISEKLYIIKYRYFCPIIMLVECVEEVDQCMVELAWFVHVAGVSCS